MLHENRDSGNVHPCDERAMLKQKKPKTAKGIRTTACSCGCDCLCQYFLKFPTLIKANTWSLAVDLYYIYNIVYGATNILYAQCSVNGCSHATLAKSCDLSRRQAGLKCKRAKCEVRKWQRLKWKIFKLLLLMFLCTVCTVHYLCLSVVTSSIG